MRTYINNIEFKYAFVDSGNFYMESLTNFYNLIIAFLIIITCLILYWLNSIAKNNFYNDSIDIHQKKKIELKK